MPRARSQHEAELGFIPGLSDVGAHSLFKVSSLYKNTGLLGLADLAQIILLSISATFNQSPFHHSVRNTAKGPGED